MSRKVMIVRAPEINGTVYVVARDIKDGVKKFESKTRIFVNGQEHLPELTIAGLELPEPKPTGEDLENDRAYARYNRTYGRVTVDVARTVYTALAKNERCNVYERDEPKLRFSRHAGCSCPCSPGVIAPEVMIFAGYPVDIFVELENVPG